MKKVLNTLIYLLALILVSCASSKSVTIIANGNDLSKYKYVVFGSSDEGDAELADILMMVQNDISQKLQVVSPEKARSLIYQGEYASFLQESMLKPKSGTVDIPIFL